MGVSVNFVERYYEGMAGKRKIKIVLNAPVVLGFAAICVVALMLNGITGGKTNSLIFSVYRSSLTDPLTYIRFFGHVFGHSGMEHLISNLMMILLLGPILEDKYGSKCLMWVIGITAVSTGLIDFIFFPSTAFLGASGVAFAFILLTSISGITSNEIPLTFILVAVLYIGQQVYEGIFVNDSVSQFTHIVGGVVGSVIGYKLNVRKR